MAREFEKKVIRFIKERKLLDSGDKVLVAFSGGPDSLCLLNLLWENKKLFGIEVSAAYVEHNLRGEESREDGKFCENFCEKRNIPFYAAEVNVKKIARERNLSVEEAARELRYSKLEEIASRLDINLIVTGHNANDNAETVLLNILKGKGISATAGIPVRRGKIVRPLLCVTREEIIEYLREQELSYRTDSSNLKNDFERNFLRNEILPKLKDKLNPSLEKTILKSTLSMESQIDFLRKTTEYLFNSFVRKDYVGVRVKLDFTKEFGTGALAEVLKKTFREFFGGELSFENLESLLDLAENQPGKVNVLPGGVSAFKERGNEIIFIKEKAKQGEKEIRTGETVSTWLGELSVGNAELSEVEKYKDDKTVEFIDAEGLEKSFFLREWKHGDFFYPLGMSKRKKISDFLTDVKVPSGLKDRYLVLTNGGRIVWLVGLRLDERFKIKKTTEKVLKLCLN